MTFLHLNMILFHCNAFSSECFFSSYTCNTTELKQGFNDDIIYHKITYILFDNPTNSFAFCSSILNKEPNTISNNISLLLQFTGVFIVSFRC